MLARSEEPTTRKPGQRMVESSYEAAKGAHGQPKEPKTKSGRKGKATDRKGLITDNVAYPGALDQVSAWRAAEKHFEDLPLEQSFLVR